MRFLLLILCCGIVSGLSAAERIAVVTGNTIVHDLTMAIGGDRITARCLLGPGVDPHSYQPVPDDVRALVDARLVIINGLGFEGWFEGLAKEAGYRGAIVVASAGVPTLKMTELEAHGDHHHAHDVEDPHAYNAILHGVRYAENIRDALITADADGADGYRTRTAVVIAALREADATARIRIAAIPKAQRVIVTTHDALQYFAAAYGFRVAAPDTALADSQPSAREVAAMVSFIRQQGVKGVFLQAGHNGKVVQQIAEEAGVRLGGTLYLDGVGPAGTPMATYIGSFLHNVDTIVAGLQ